MDKEVQSDGGTLIIVSARAIGTRVYFSTEASRAQAYWDTITKEWRPGRHQFGDSMKAKIAVAFKELL